MSLTFPPYPPRFLLFFHLPTMKKIKVSCTSFFFARGGHPIHHLRPFINLPLPPLACSSSSSTTLPSIYNHRLPFLPTFPTFPPPFPYHTFFFV